MKKITGEIHQRKKTRWDGQDWIDKEAVSTDE